MDDNSHLLMPKLGLTMTEGMVSQWVIREGQSFKAGDIVVVVESDKTAFDVEAPAAGSLLRILVAEQETVDVGSPLAQWRLEGDIRPNADRAGEQAVARLEGQSTSASDASLPSAGSAVGEPGARALASPRVRRRALEAGFDLNSICGSGPDGQITDADLTAALEAAPRSRESAKSRNAREEVGPTAATETSAEGNVSMPSLLQKTMAERVAIAKREIPHFYLAVDVHATPMLATLRAFNADHPSDKATITHLLIAALVKALRTTPAINAVWTERGIRRLDRANIGLAVDTERGLVNPVLRDLDDGRFSQIRSKTREAIDKARRGTLRAEDHAEAAITLSNAGTRHVHYMSSIIVPGQSSILGVGAIQQVFRPNDRGEPSLREELGVVLSSDHRLHTGVSALAFLKAFEDALGNPIELIQGC